MSDQIKERPILMSAPMVRALLDGSKTQTRRIINGQAPEWDHMSHAEEDIHGKEFFFVCGQVEPGRARLRPILDSITCPYGQPSDRLWVRETWGVVSHSWDDDGAVVDWTPDRPATPIHELPFGKGYYSGHAIYAADGSYEWAGDDDGGGEPRSAWHPSIHMPRRASRILLEVVSVRVERLQDISEDDCWAEGIDAVDGALDDMAILDLAKRMNRSCHDAAPTYAALWESINGAGSWDANPWVWVVEFKRVTP